MTPVLSVRQSWGCINNRLKFGDGLAASQHKGDCLKQLVLYAEQNHCEYAVNELMSRHTSMKVGGRADFVIFPNTAETVAGVVKICKEAGLPLTVLGNGSNLLVSDAGLRGVVMILGTDFSHTQYCGDGLFHAQAGASLTRLCRLACQHGMTGLEFAFGIPGSVGGAAFMNAGAYGGEMKDILFKCRHVTPDGRVEELSAEEMELSYRHSAYYHNGCIITDVFVQLEPGDSKQIKEKMDELMNRRKLKQPLEYPSAGSTFKRPEGCFAGTLIEACGLKGKRIGGAQVSEKHAGFLINAGGATCQDILDLAAFVEQAVYQEKGVKLEMEIRVLK